MSYIDQNLLSGEKIIYRTTLHWIVFIWPVIFILLAIMFAGSSGAAGGVLFVVAMVAGMSSYITYSSSEFGVTNKRVLVKVGFIQRHSLETLLPKVEGISVDQGILGRMLGYGTIVITGTGGTKEPFHKINGPFEFRKQVQE
jgi:uncharacterized membrane protein YdbT with pleckstrin-like domain